MKIRLIINRQAVTVLTSAELVVGSVTVEVVTLAELAAVDLFGVVPLLAFAGAAHTVPVVAADIRPVVFTTVGVQVLRPHIVLAALAQMPDATLVTPDRAQRSLTDTATIHKIFKYINSCFAADK